MKSKTPFTRSVQRVAPVVRYLAGPRHGLASLLEALLEAEESDAALVLLSNSLLSTTMRGVQKRMSFELSST